MADNKAYILLTTLLDELHKIEDAKLFRSLKNILFHISIRSYRYKIRKCLIRESYDAYFIYDYIIFLMYLDRFKLFAKDNNMISYHTFDNDSSIDFFGGSICIKSGEDTKIETNIKIVIDKLSDETPKISMVWEVDHIGTKNGIKVEECSRYSDSLDCIKYYNGNSNVEEILESSTKPILDVAIMFTIDYAFNTITERYIK